MQLGVMPRLAPDDLSATLAEMGGWLRISLPLIAEAKEIFEDHRGRVLTHRRPGDLRNEARMSREDFERFKRSRQPHIFEAQYQQHPSYGGSGFGSKSLTAHPSRRPLRGLLRMRDSAFTTLAILSKRALVSSKFGD
jgi:hypothetical protein